MITQAASFSQRFYLNLPHELIEEHVICQLSERFELVSNLKGVKMVDKFGIVALELIGEKNEIEKALEWLIHKGAQVETGPAKALQPH